MQFVGNVIRIHRRLADLSQAALAAKLRVSQMQLSRFERGAAEPTPAQLRTLERVLGVTFSEAEERAS